MSGIFGRRYGSHGFMGVMQHTDGMQVELIRKIVPSVKTVGMIYNPAEANSRLP